MQSRQKGLVLFEETEPFPPNHAQAETRKTVTPFSAKTTTLGELKAPVSVRVQTRDGSIQRVGLKRKLITLVLTGGDS